MPTEDDIRRALHASRVVPLDVANPHGPLGLEQLAGAVALARGDRLPDRVQRPITFSLETWQKLSRLAQSPQSGDTLPRSPSELASALLEQLVAAG